jgi:large subunit ribosomal protein L20
MPRVRKGAARTQARKRILRKARGFFGVNHLHRYRADYAVIRAGCYAYRDRRTRKRNYRRLWITRITAACQMRDTRYSRFINGLKLAGITLNRKMLSQLAIEDPKAFDQLVQIAEKNTRAAAKVAA